MKRPKRYDEYHINKLADCLDDAGIAPETSAQILEGATEVHGSSTGKAKAAWLGEAMERMSALLPEETCHSVRESCACCLGGKRLELSKGIAKEHATLEERIAAANETHFVFGDAVWQTEDGRIWVRFAPEGLEKYSCPCLREAAEPLPILYCYCCGGHVKHHLQIALGRELEVTAHQTTLSSGGTKPCLFSFTLVEPEAG